MTPDNRIDRGGKRTGQRPSLVIAASSLGTIFEWYDFYLYGLLATVLSAKFFSGVRSDSMCRILVE